MVEQSKAWVLGDPWSESTTMGPQNNPAVVARMQQHVTDAVERGAKVVAGGERPDLPGYFHQPTILTGFAPDSLVNREETFGPIAPIRAFASVEQANELIHSSSLGLVSSVFTENVHEAWRWAERLRTGVVVVNDNSNYWEPHIPFGGMAGTTSGLGRLGGRHVLEFMSDLQTVAFHVR
jgi:succinate-semialdehyde dehydrogenase/glutarate-semialdehyde dehydrogenase